MATNENLPPNVIKQLARELKNLDEVPPEGIKVGISNDDFSTIFADIEGPAGTPYENGTFRMKLLLSHDFPHSPPKGYFLTKIFHPNIATNGEICVNTLKRDWNPSLGLRHVLLVVRCLMIEPFAESALNEQAGKLLLENYEEYARHARIITGIHALKPKPKFKTGAISESTTALNVDNTKMTHLNVENTKTAAAVVPLAGSPLTASAIPTGSKGGSSCHDPQPVVGVLAPSEPLAAVGVLVPNETLAAVGVLVPNETLAAVGVLVTSEALAAAQKKVPVGSTMKGQTDKKKIDARKKSLKRL